MESLLCKLDGNKKLDNEKVRKTRNIQTKRTKNKVDNHHEKKIKEKVKAKSTIERKANVDEGNLVSNRKMKLETVPVNTTYSSKRKLSESDFDEDFDTVSPKKPKF